MRLYAQCERQWMDTRIGDRMQRGGAQALVQQLVRWLTSICTALKKFDSLIASV